jgi:hypothetical protein
MFSEARYRLSQQPRLCFELPCDTAWIPYFLAPEGAFICALLYVLHPRDNQPFPIHAKQDHYLVTKKYVHLHQGIKDGRSQ